MTGGTNGLIVTMPTRTRASDMRGRVLTTAGVAIEDAKVTVYHRAFGVSFDDGSRTVWDYEGASTRTDRNGEFGFAALPHEGVSLYVSGEGLKSRKIAYQKGSAAVLRIELETKEGGLAHFRVELADATRANGFYLIDMDGKHAGLHVIRGGSRVSTTTAELREGTSMVFAVAPGSYEWVLTRDAQEVDRRTVTIEGKDVVFLRD